MKLRLLAVGRAGTKRPEIALIDDYRQRLTWPLTIQEVEEKRPLPSAALKKREGELLLAALDGGKAGSSKAGGGKAGRQIVVVLDERGRSLTSRDFAARIGAWRDDGAGEIVFLIGGADGHDEAVRTRADLLLSLGSMTWPHQMVRVLLAEQLYRAQQILAGHPYHRD
ncbi:MAG TPA: 23S rRNA (pseudouridine(1915)-N(3))-methyltransferase RlmH [Terriglobales bacterium]|nr:23S rRNA (pseudouridine(1915)-N(3))-methyltransferase RlmH [Terriglobales bacterium]